MIFQYVSNTGIQYFVWVLQHTLVKIWEKLTSKYYPIKISSDYGIWRYFLCGSHFLVAWLFGEMIMFCKVEKILKGSLDSIPSPSPSVKIQIMGGKVCMRCEGETLLGFVNKLLKTKSLLSMPSNFLPLHLK